MNCFKWAALGWAIVCAAAAQAGELQGQALYRERIALPDGAAFQAVLTATSGSTTTELGRAAADGADGPPYAFAITYDDSALVPGAHYSLRASVLVGGKPVFAADMALGLPAEEPVSLLMTAVPPAEAAGQQRLIAGMMRYMADAALLEDCADGLTYPIAMEGGYLALERAYLAAAPAAGEPLYVLLDGTIAPRPAMEGPDRDSAVVGAALAVWPGTDCAGQAHPADLAGTEWRIDSLKGQPVTAEEEGRSPQFQLRPDAGAYSATVGCNQIHGTYTAGAEGALTLAPGATTLMACPPPLDALERALAQVLEATRAYAIAGGTLVLRDQDGTAIAVMTAH
ncbi:MAG: META domain-containing protein [Roseivivax sp.]|nr:META domain-containing protein [Roseivivax sp.]